MQCSRPQLFHRPLPLVHHAVSLQHNSVHNLLAAEVYSNLEPSAKNLVEKVHEYMENVLWTLTGSVSAAFPRLQNAIKALVSPSILIDSINKYLQCLQVCLDVNNKVKRMSLA